MATSRLASSELRVGGMDCASCASTIEAALKQLDGVEEVRVDVVGGRVRVAHAEDKVGRREIAGAIRRVGYLPDDRGHAHDATVVAFWERRGRVVMTVAAGAMMLVGILVERLGAPAWIGITLLALSTLAGGWYVVPRGVRAAFNRSLDMNVLMSVAAGGAWIIGEQTEAAATLFLFAVAELLEAFSMDRARNAIKALMDLSPADASVLRDGVEVRVPVGDIAIGETIVVRPGEKVAVDGEVTSGRSSVNQAPITGESMPVDKELGAEVFAGSLNVQGALEVRSTKRASDTTLARILHAVEEAQASRAPSQTFVERFARVYTPVVVAAALLLAVGPPLLGFGDWSTWIYRALAMLVVACPCALVISTPVSIVSGLTGAARAGVLIKGGAYLEAAGAVTTVCFDKTGTLTEGRPAVTNVVALNGHGERDVLRLAASVEQYSEHPLAHAILEAARQDGPVPPAYDFQALVGRGARAQVDHAAVYIGNERLMHEAGAVLGAASETVAQLEEQGNTVVLVAMRSEEPPTRAIGAIAVADRVRPEARDALESLRRSGIGRTVMLTGDNEGTARAVAKHAGVDEYHAALLPDDKVRIVRTMESKGARVAFVGDGVNDAPALASATVGVAMGGAGTDVALETADIVLMADDLTRLSFAMRLSRRTLRIIRQNIWFSLAVKAAFLVLAVSGWATLWMAVAADMGASLVVIANGLRALRGA